MEALATSSTCPECHGDGYRVEAEVQPGPGDGEGRRARAVARICGCRERCPHCEGRGFVYTSREVEFSKKVGARRYEALAPCLCRLLGQRISEFAAVGIPAHHASSSFATFRAKGDDQEKTAALEQALGIARTVAQEWRRDRPARGFVISGRVGSGKTHLLSATLRHLVLERGASAQYREISLLYADIRRGFNAGKSGGEIIARLVDADILAIDELGRGRGSPFEMETLDELIARRYNSGLTTIVATNFSLERERTPTPGPRGFQAPEQALGEREELLVERIGERIYSRLCEMCDFVSLPGRTDDFRRTKQDGRPTRRLVRPAS
ncbi:MAG TPA: ATP-binding protein [Polyangiaceae bacterium]|nr:ATP-binding protein [Polyangiaceae bacterium]